MVRSAAPQPAPGQLAPTSTQQIQNHHPGTAPTTGLQFKLRQLDRQILRGQILFHIPFPISSPLLLLKCWCMSQCIVAVVPPDRIYHSLKLYTQIGTNRYEKYLYVMSADQPAYSFNSDNMWFPMPPSRLVYLTVPAAHNNNVGFCLFVTGYR